MVKKFEVYFCDIRGQEKPCVILSPDEMNALLPYVLVAPITKAQRNFPCRMGVKLKGEKAQSEGGKGKGSFSPLQGTAASGAGLAAVEREAQNDAAASLCTSVIRQHQRRERRFPVFGGQSPFCPPKLPHAMCRLLQEHVNS